MTKIVLIGAGIAAECFKFALNKNGLDSDIELVQIHAEDACTYNTTSVVALRGTRRGLSELGDLIVDSYEAFQKHFNNGDFEGVSKSPLFHFSRVGSEESEKFKRRYSDVEIDSKIHIFNAKGDFYLHQESSYIITPEDFVPHLSKSCNFKSYKEIKAIVTKVENGSVVYENKLEDFDICIDCSGYQILNYNHLENFNIENVKPAHGSYLITKGDLGDQPFNLTYDDVNLTYRENKDILIGSTSAKRTSKGIEITRLKEMYSLFKDEINIPLPDIETFIAKEGIRSKGKKLRPTCKKIDEKIYMVNNLYKNGFSYPFVLCFDLVEMLKSDNLI